MLNRTIWTNRKAYRSGITDSPACGRCEEDETMEHLIYGCENYSAILWREYSTLLTDTLTHLAGHRVARIDHTPKEIIFNLPHPSIHLYVQDQPSRVTLLYLIQETKRDIIHKRMTLTTPRGVIPLPRIHAHILSVINKISSQMEYQGAKPQSEMMHLLRIMRGSLENLINGT